MSNRTFLYIWFPLSWIVTTAVAAGITRWLWSPVMGLAEKYGSSLRRWMKVVFPAGITLPAFAGFLSISYFQRGCGTLADSASVIADPTQLHEVAQHEMAAVAEWLVYALIVWAVFYTILLVVWHRGHLGSAAE